MGSKAEKTTVEVDNDLVKNSKAHTEVIFDKAPLESADDNLAESDDQFEAHNTTFLAKYLKSEAPDAATFNPLSQTQNAETAFNEEHFSEINPSWMENVRSNSTAEIYEEFLGKVEDFDDIVHDDEQLDEEIFGWFLRQCYEAINC